MRLKKINGQNDILEIVQEMGFLPFFENDIEGFPIEENIAPQYWKELLTELYLRKAHAVCPVTCISNKYTKSITCFYSGRGICFAAGIELLYFYS